MNKLKIGGLVCMWVMFALAGWSLIAALSGSFDVFVKIGYPIVIVDYVVFCVLMFIDLSR